MSSITSEPTLEPQAIPWTKSTRWMYIAPSLLVVWIVSMFDKINMGIVMANGSFLHELNLVGKPALLGELTTGLALAYGIFAPVWGWIQHRIGPRRVALYALALWAIGSVWSGLATSYGSLLASRVLLGASEAALYPLTLALVARWFPMQERARATAFWWIGTMIGPALAGFLVTGLILWGGWRFQFYMIGGIALIPLAMFYWLVRDDPRQHPRVSSQEVALIEAGAIERQSGVLGRHLSADLGQLFRNYRFWFLVVALVGNNIFWWGWSVWLPTYLHTVRHFTFALSGFLSGAIFAAAVVTILIMGRISDRMFRRAGPAAIGWLVGAGLLMGAALVPSPTLSVVLMALALCSQQVGISMGESLMHSIVRAQDMAVSQGVRSLIMSVVGALAPAIVGVLIGASGNFVGAFVLFAVAILVSSGFTGLLAAQGY